MLEERIWKVRDLRDRSPEQPRPAYLFTTVYYSYFQPTPDAERVGKTTSDIAYIPSCIFKCRPYESSPLRAPEGYNSYISMDTEP